MARPRDPIALKSLKGKAHITKDQKAEISNELYVSNGKIKPPECLTDKHMLAMFKKNAHYMERVNEKAGVRIYGDTDIETLTEMVMSHFRYLQYQSKEEYESDPVEKQRYNSMKNKEAATYHKMLKALKLDPGARVYFKNKPEEEYDAEF